jgi:hypothetical protein
MVDNYEKGDERINVEEVVRQDVWIDAPPCLAEEPRLVVEHDLRVRFISSWRGHTLKELFQHLFDKRRVGQEDQGV